MRRWRLWGWALGLAWSVGDAVGEAAADSVTLEKNGVMLHLHGMAEPLAEELRMELVDQITLSGDTAPTEPLADDLAYFARQHLVRGGHPAAVVRWRLQGRDIHLDMEPGERVRLGQVMWEGELPLAEDELRRYFLRPAQEREGADKKAPFWVEEDARAGAALVARRLRAEGYLDAVVDLTRLPGGDPLRQDARLSIRAGPRYSLGVLTLAGVPKELEEAMQAVVEEAKGGPFSEGRLQALERRLLDAATRRGWLGSTVVSEFQRPSNGGEVNVVLRVTPGVRPVIMRVEPDPHFSRGAQRVLRAGFKPLVGGHWSADAADLAYRRLLDTGLFAMLDDQVELLEETPIEDGLLAAALRVEGAETRPKTLGIEAALDTFLGFQVGLNYRNTNLWDSGRILAAAANYSLAGPTGFLSLSDPALFDSAYAGTARLSGDYFVRYEYARYTLALDVDISRRLTRNFSWSVYAAISVSAVASDLPAAWIGPDAYGYYTGGLAFLLDFRDSPVLPKKGWFLSVRGDYNLDGIGDGASYVRNETRASWLLPLTDKWRLAFGAMAESIQGAAFAEIPIDNRVFNGGPNSVRAFAMRELGPVTAGGTPLGGTAAVFASAELSRVILPNLEWAVFFDSGSLDLRESNRPFHFSPDFRHAVGVGLRYLLPFGPLRLDYGYNLDRREGEDRGQVHVTAGFAF